MKQVVPSATAIARMELGHSVRVEVDGLEPGRDYFYRFRAGASESPIGRSRTLPAHGAEIARLRFGVAGCQQWEGGFYTAWAEVRQSRGSRAQHAKNRGAGARAAGSSRTRRKRRECRGSTYRQPCRYRSAAPRPLRPRRARTTRSRPSGNFKSFHRATKASASAISTQASIRRAPSRATSVRGSSIASG
jgi:hypothetical protein